MGSKHIFDESMGALERRVVKLYALVTFGATGAPTLTRGKGITSISRSSAGVYVITLDDSYVRLLAVKGTFKATTGVPAAPLIFESANDAVATASARTLQLTTCAASGTSGALVATDPASGESLKLEITLGNSGAV